MELLTNFFEDFIDFKKKTFRVGLPNLIGIENLNKNYFIEKAALLKLYYASQDDIFILFRPMANLLVYVHLVEINNEKCWLYITNGLCVNAQDELVFFLKYSDTKEVPKEIIYHIMDIYDKSSKGFRISYMNHLLYSFENETLFSQILRTNSHNNITSDSNSIFENKDNSAFFYFRPTKFHLNKLKNLVSYCPDQPFLIGYLIQKLEIPWAKLFPLRLLLRLGEHLENYPCPLISDPKRRSVFGEIGHTIMSLLSDTRNFQYTIPQIDGVTITIEGLKTHISIPESQYDFLIKSLLTSNDYVFSFASLQINESVNSHLVAIENENLDSFSSKTIKYQENESKTSAAFVVFNGAFKTTMTQNAKQTVIEDGLMIQIDIDTMNKLKQSLQSMKSFRIECSKIDSSQIIHIDWSKEDKHLNKNIFSVIDGKPMEGIKSLRLANSLDYVTPNESKSIKWSEIYILKIDEESIEDDSSFNLNKFTEMISTAGCMALSPLLKELVELRNDNKKFFEPFRIGLRIEINKDQVGYILGMFKKQINDCKILEALDNHLIQILHQVNSMKVDLLLEFVFFVQDTQVMRIK